MPIDIGALYDPTQPYGFRQELDGTNMSVMKLERVLSRRWNDKYAVEVIPPSPNNFHYLIVHSRCSPTDLLYVRRAFFLLAILLAAIDINTCFISVCFMLQSSL
jgi:hypothetical protein